VFAPGEDYMQDLRSSLWKTCRAGFPVCLDSLERLSYAVKEQTA